MKVVEMRQTTLPEQTAKLIELGFAQPKIHVVAALENNPTVRVSSWRKRDFSIGELIELLPQYLEYKGGVTGIPIDYYALTIRQNVVMYCDPYMDWIEIQCDDHKELIDNLYDMVVRLKEEGVI